MAYADSSLLLKLYLREPETPAALEAMGRASGPVFFTELHRLEIVNAIRRKLAAKRIRRSQALKALRTLRQDLRSGIYTLQLVDWPGIFRRAFSAGRIA
jgi:predicted nucleic acid-binding protein